MFTTEYYSSLWYEIIDVVKPFLRAYRKVSHLIKSITGYDPRKFIFVDYSFFKRVVRVRFDTLDLGGDVMEIIIYYSVAKSPLRPYRVFRVIKKLSPPDNGYRFTGKLHRYRFYVGKATRGAREELRNYGVIVMRYIDDVKRFFSDHMLRRLNGILASLEAKHVKKPFGRYAVFVYFLQLIGNEFGNDFKVFSSDSEVIRLAL